MPCPIGERIVPAMAADGADGATTVAVGATRTTGPVVGAGAGAAAAAVEIVKKEVGEGAPMHRIIGTSGIALAVGDVEINSMATVGVVDIGGDRPTEQGIDTMAGADGVSAVRIATTEALGVPLRGITLMGMPRPHEIATETNPETSGQHRREMHQMAMVDRPSYNPS